MEIETYSKNIFVHALHEKKPFLRRFLHGHGKPSWNSIHVVQFVETIILENNIEGRPK
jgi:hypothetical protein